MLPVSEHSCAVGRKEPINQWHVSIENKIENKIKQLVLYRICYQIFHPLKIQVMVE